MSVVLFPDDILFDQRLLACGGFYKDKLDGLYGDKTRAAEDAAHESYLNCAKRFGSFDPRSEKNIATLLPAMQVKARRILGVAIQLTDLRCQILSGTRTYAEQNALFVQRPKVTNARGGQSNHNFGIAIDVGLFRGQHYLTGATQAEEKAYSDLARIVKNSINDLEWGGDWRTFKDQPHYQLATGKNLDQVRAAFETGRAFT